MQIHNHLINKKSLNADIQGSTATTFAAFKTSANAENPTFLSRFFFVEMKEYYLARHRLSARTSGAASD
jgi:hypothetical protein